MTIPFPFHSGQTSGPNGPPPPEPPRSKGPVLVENIVAKKLNEIRVNAEQTAIDSMDVVPDTDRLEALRRSASDEIKESHMPEFDPANNDDDRLTKTRLDWLRESEKRLENASVQEKAISNKAADEVPATPPDYPQAPIPIVICGILAFAMEVGTAIHPLLTKTIEDGPTALGAAGLAGIVVGVVVVYGAMGIGGSQH